MPLAVFRHCGKGVVGADGRFGEARAAGGTNEKGRLDKETAFLSAAPWRQPCLECLYRRRETTLLAGREVLVHDVLVGDRVDNRL